LTAKVQLLLYLLSLNRFSYGKKQEKFPADSADQRRKESAESAGEENENNVPLILRINADEEFPADIADLLRRKVSRRFRG